MKLVPFRPRPGARTDRQARFEARVGPHLGSLYRTAYRLSGHPQDAEDLVQELLLRLYRKSEQLGQLDNLHSWLNRALHNLFVDQWRRGRHTPLRNLYQVPWDELLQDQDSQEDDPERLAHTEAVRDRILAALYTLGREQRAILVLHDMEGHTMNELCGLLDLPLGTVKSRLFRARRRLRTLLEEGNLSQGIGVLLHEASET